ncbi:hypothetical protein ONO23_03095 [Micromonospora noduli]|nr:hypothetical protein ONO23_03095 [Micromonospora noduli]RAO53859.1 hypothetical protein ONO86_01365 [Micromonospora noduli]
MNSTNDRAVVIASELISNAVLHVGTEVDITVSARPGSLRTSVRDQTAGTPAHWWIRAIWPKAVEAYPSSAPRQTN